MKIKVITLIGIIVLVTSCKNDVKKVSKLESHRDSLSYALGIMNSQQVKYGFENIDKDILVQGFYNGTDSTNLLMKFEDAARIIDKYMYNQQEENRKELAIQERNKAEKEFADWKKQNDTFMSKNKTKNNVITTDSGLQYIVLKKGKGERPVLTDKIKVHYKASKIDGKIYEDSYERNKPSEFVIKGSMKGLEEGLQLMKKGSKYKFFVPYRLGYNISRKIPHIKPFSTLIYEIELLDIKSENKKK